MNYDLILWDWNGTLLDDAAWCVEVTNRMLGHRGLPIMSMEKYRQVFTFPVEEYYREIGFDLEAESFAALSVEFNGLYGGPDRTYTLRKGARAVLQTIDARGLPQAVLSASEQNNLNRQMAEFGLTGYFAAVLGIEDIYAKSKMELGRRYMARCGHSCVLLIGDTTHDWEVAQALGADCLLLAHGHQCREVLSGTGAAVAEGLEDVLTYVTERAG